MDLISPKKLVVRIAQRDRTAEAALVEQYGGRLRTLLNARVSDPGLAEDLYQETFIVVLNKLRENELEDPSRLAGYIIKTAINLNIGQIRKDSRRNTTVNSKIVGMKEHEGLTPEETTERDSSRRAVRLLIGELPQERDRAILFLFYVKEMEKSKICEQLQLSPTNFDRVIWRAKKRFRRIVESLAPELV